MASREERYAKLAIAMEGLGRETARLTENHRQLLQQNSELVQLTREQLTYIKSAARSAVSTAPRAATNEP